MKEARLYTLIKKMRAGRLSRNKNYEAFLDPEIQDAKRRQTRLQSLAKMLLVPERLDITLDRVKADNGSWKLTCKSTRLDLFWSAVLLNCELKLLLEHPGVRKTLNSLLPKDSFLSSKA